MAVIRKQEPRLLLMNKEKVRRLADELNRQFGIIPDPTATPRKAREMMRALGIHAEDNIFSRDLIRLRNQR